MFKTEINTLLSDKQAIIFTIGVILTAVYPTTTCLEQNRATLLLRKETNKSDNNSSSFVVTRVYLHSYKSEKIIAHNKNLQKKC